MARILIVDDEENIRVSLRSALEKRGHECVTSESLAKAREYIGVEFDITLLDVMLGDGNGLDLLREILRRSPHRCVVMISGHADIEMAVEAIRMGAYDFIEKPLSLDRILITIDNAGKASRLRTEKDRLAGIVYGTMIGESEPIQKLREDIRRSAPRTSRFLILGENGTGKELAAHMIHRRSRYADGPFVAVNCAALPSELVESELFGHVKGAFTGATRDRTGKFAEADGGSIFLDEISEMPPEAQAKILRVIETKQVSPVGSDTLIEVNCNIIAASNRDLEKYVAEGKFRQDLYYRLNVVTFALPPLRRRSGDIRLLAEHFLKRFADESGGGVRTLADEAVAMLEHHAFKGNVRELKNLIERVNIYCDQPEIDRDALAPFLPTSTTNGSSNLRSAVAHFEREYIENVIDRCNGNMAEAARRLGLERSHLYKKLKKLNGQARPQ